MLLPVISPVSIRLMIITHKDPKQNNHGNLPNEANSWQADPDIRVFRIVPETLANVSHCDCNCYPKTGHLSSRSLCKEKVHAEIFIVESLEVCLSYTRI